jgi:hypothetical protein
MKLHERGFFFLSRVGRTVGTTKGSTAVSHGDGKNLRAAASPRSTPMRCSLDGLVHGVGWGLHITDQGDLERPMTP